MIAVKHIYCQCFVDLLISKVHALYHMPSLGLEIDIMINKEHKQNNISNLNMKMNSKSYLPPPPPKKQQVMNSFDRWYYLKDNSILIVPVIQLEIHRSEKFENHDGERVPLLFSFEKYQG